MELNDAVPSSSSSSEIAAAVQILNCATEDDGSFLYHDGHKLRVLRTESTFEFCESIDRATCGYIKSHCVEGIRMVSMSGWRARRTKDRRVLDGAKYTQLVRDASEIMGFHLPADRWDYGGQAPREEDKGRFAACHIEKKLAIWWARKTLKAVLRTKDLNRLAELRDAGVPESMRAAVIYLDHTPCFRHGCVQFLEMLGKTTGITFMAKKIPFLEKGVRTQILFVHKDGEVENQSASIRPSKAYERKEPAPYNAPEYSSPPRKWIRYEGNVAKPPKTRLTSEEARRLQESPARPIQNTKQALEIPLQQITPAQQSEFARVPVSPGPAAPAPLRKSPKVTQISRFRYIPPSKNLRAKKPKRLLAREAKIRKNSLFAKAAERRFANINIG